MIVGNVIRLLREARAAPPTVPGLDVTAETVQDAPEDAPSAVPDGDDTVHAEQP